MDAMQRIQAVIFDAAGTLIHLREPVGETYARLAREHGVDVPGSRLDEAFHRVFAATSPNVHPGVPLEAAIARERDWWRDLVRGTFRAADGRVRLSDFSDFDAYFAALFAHYGTTSAWALAPDTGKTLTGLAERGIALAVISNFDQRLRRLLQALEIHELFGAVVLPADVGAAKPDRMIFDACLKRLGLAAHRSLYVGDHAVEDVEAAKTAGMNALNIGAIATLAEVPAHVDALEKEWA